MSPLGNFCTCPVENACCVAGPSLFHTSGETFCGRVYIAGGGGGVGCVCFIGCGGGVNIAIGFYLLKLDLLFSHIPKNVAWLVNVCYKPGKTREISALIVLSMNCITGTKAMVKNPQTKPIEIVTNSKSLIIAPAEPNEWKKL